MHIIQVISLYILFASFTWAAIFYFKSTDKSAMKGKILITALGTPLTIYILYSLIYKTFNYSFLGLVLTTISFILFWLTIRETKKTTFHFAFSNNVPQTLVLGGPYKYIRHPFYLSYTIGWLASAIVLKDIVTYIGLILMFTVYYFSAKFEENTILKSIHKENYIKYKKQTGMFLLKIFK